jgi:adenosylmethionine-8-amino-7-oxononanoate aminotransferase
MRDTLVERVREKGPVLMQAIEAAVGNLDAVGDIRGRGFLIGVEFVADRETRRPFEPGLRVTEVIRERTLEAGLICYPVSGTVDGIVGDVAIVSPPYNASDEVLGELVERFANAVHKAATDLGAS